MRKPYFQKKLLDNIKKYEVQLFDMKKNIYNQFWENEFELWKSYIEDANDKLEMMKIMKKMKKNSSDDFENKENNEKSKKMLLRIKNMTFDEWKVRRMRKSKDKLNNMMHFKHMFDLNNLVKNRSMIIRHIGYIDYNDPFVFNVKNESLPSPDCLDRTTPNIYVIDNTKKK